MRTILDSFGPLRTRRSFEREIAPGVSIKINKPPVSFSLTKSHPIAGLSHRVHDAWDVLCGKAHAMPSRLQERLRRAA